MPQEIRNCTARMLGDEGVKFYKFLQDCAATPQFKNCTETLSSSDREQKADEELVLRFFATKNAQDMFHGSVRDWLDDYMESVLLRKVEFEYVKELTDFTTVFDVLNRVIGAGAFVRYRGQEPVGGLAPAYFESVTIGTFRNLPGVVNVDSDAFRQAIAATVQGEDFRRATGPGANSREKLESRIATIQSAIGALI